MTKARYHLRFGVSRTLCDHMGCPAGLRLCQEAGVTSCSHRTLKEARAAMRAINGLPGWAGAVSIAQGECPRMDPEDPHC